MKISQLKFNDITKRAFKDLRTKIFILFTIMGMVPFLIFIIAGAYNMVEEQKVIAKETGTLRNAIISGHMTDLIKKNQVVLQSLAMSPNLIDYLKNPTEERYNYVTKILSDTDDIFNDGNLTALTRADGWQVFRSDGATLVNLKKRQHFQEAMKGRSYVSDIIASMSTGKMIVVLAVPVIDLEGKPVGMVQRNFNLNILQDYVKLWDDSENSIIVMDRNYRVIANSDNVTGLGNEYVVDSTYKSIIGTIYNSNGAKEVTINGEKTLFVYSRNIDTGWIILTLRPYKHIMNKVYDKSQQALVFGLCTMLMAMIVAYILAMRVANPIIEITNVVDKIAEGDTSVQNLEVNRDDELGQMAAAFNRLRYERDTFQTESELDRLTGLLNKKAMENLCRQKLKALTNSAGDNDSSDILMAFYIIDLDHFKEVNDLLGHQFGDKVLVEFSTGLKKISHPNESIGRFGGDEFILTTDNPSSLEAVLRKAEQIRRVAKYLTIDGSTDFVTASIGIAIAPHDGLDYDTLFAVADKAVYHVKNSGKDNFYCEFFAKQQAAEDDETN